MRRKIFNIIRGSNPEQPLSYYLDYFITGLIVANVIAIVLESYEELYIPFKDFFFVFEIFTVVVFTSEYLLRVWTSDLLYPKEKRLKAALKFMFSWSAMVDLLAILPFYLPFLIKMDLRFIRALRLVRLLRILKLSRYNRSISIIGKVLKETKSQLGVTVFVCLILIILASTLMYNLEKSAQPDQFDNIGNAIWWAIATLTTVGYGDIYPITGWGKLLSGVIALLGIGLIALPTGIISSAFMELIDESKTSHENHDANFKYCPHCGKAL